MKSILHRFLPFFLSLTLACHSQYSNSLSPLDFESALKESGVQVLDVRTSGEYQNGHIMQSLLADWTNQEQFQERIKFLDKTKPVCIYCQSGGRSSAAAKWMRDNGFSKVIELKGGINAWKMASLQLEEAAEPKQMSLKEYQSQIGNEGVVLVDLGAEWCPPCKKMEPVISQLQKEMGDKFRLVKIDGGAQLRIMQELHVDQIPTFIIYKNGQESWRKQGITDLASFVKELTKQ